MNPGSSQFPTDWEPVDPLKLPPTEAEWLQHKESIWQMYAFKQMELRELQSELEKAGFVVTITQLKYRLRKWNFRQNFDAKTWDEIGRRTDKRKGEGKGSDIIHNLRRWKPSKIAKGTKRTRPSKVSTRHTGTLVSTPNPSSPSAIQVFVCTPPPHHMDFHSQWPPSLPWLQFWSRFQPPLTRHPAVSNLHKRHHQITDIEPMLKIHDNFLPFKFQTRDRISSAHPGLLELASMISMTMPELDEDENVRRAGALTGHPGPDALFECLAIAMYHISNNLYGQLDSKRWETIVTIFRHCGLMERPFGTPAPRQTTISAYLEKFYQATVYQAVFRDNADVLDVIKWLLRSGQTPDALVLSWSGFPMTAMEACIECGRVDLLRLLLDHGADPNLASRKRPTGRLRPLEYALGHKYRSKEFNEAYQWPLPTRVEIARLLISKGAKVNLPVSDDWEPVLNLAIGLGDLDLVELVVAHGADIQLGAQLRPNLLHTITPLNRAAGFCDKVSVSLEKRPGTAVALVRYITGLLRQQFPSSYKAEITLDTFTAAAAAGNYDVITFLADLSLPANFTSPLGVTPLHGAAEHGCVQTCQILLQLGCPLNSQSKYISPLHIACAFGHDKIVDIFIQNGAHLNARVDLDWDSSHRHRMRDMLDYLCSGPWTPLEMAILFRKKTCAVSLLRGHQATVFGGELLLAARRDPDIALLSALLDAGADPNERDGNGKSVLRHLFEWVRKHSGFVEVKCGLAKDAVKMVELLLSWRVKVDFADLVGAFRLGIRSVSLALLQCDSRSAEKGESRARLFEEAMLSGDTAIVEMVSQLYQDLPYNPVAVCTAVIAKSGAKRIKQLLAVRSHHARPNIYEATAIGIAAHQREDMDRLQVLCIHLPPSRTCFMPVRYRWSDWGLNLFYFERSARYWSHSVMIEVSPLTYPVLGHNDDAFNYLLEHDYKPDWTTWLVIAQENQTQMALALQEERFTLGKPNPGFWDGSRNDQRLFPQGTYAPEPLTVGHPLNHAISHGNVDLVRILLDAGLSINHSIRDEFRGRTALQFAVELANLEIIHFLLSAGADVNAPPARERGATALQMAAVKGLLGIAKLLLERGAEVNAPRAPQWGRTALEAAAEHGRIDMIELLFCHGVGTTGTSRRQYIRSVKFAEAEGHTVAANRIRDHRLWTDEDEQLLSSPDILDEETLWSDEEHYSDSDSERESEEEDEDDDDEGHGEENDGKNDNDEDDSYEEGEHDNGVGNNDRDCDDRGDDEGCGSGVGGNADEEMFGEENEMINFDVCDLVEGGGLRVGNIDQNNRGVMNAAGNGDTMETAITSTLHVGQPTDREGGGVVPAGMRGGDPIWWEKDDDENSEDFERFGFV